MSYCYRSKVNRYESPWSLSNKLGYWNACTFSDLIDHFGSKNWSVSYVKSYTLFRNLFSAGKIADATGVDLTTVKSGYLNEYFNEDEFLLFIEPKLRICPKCIKLGYHSCFHQLSCITYCPGHNIRLTTRCPFCKRQFTECYNRDIHNYYSCCNCGRMLANLEIANTEIVEAVLTQFDSVADLLLMRKATKHLSARPHDFIREKTSRYFFNQMFSLWQVLYSKEDLSKDGIQVLEIATLEKCEYIYIPEEIMRLVSDHAYCISQIGKAGFWLLHGVEIVGYHLCPYALAFIFFRMYRDSLDSGHGVCFDTGPPFHRRDYDYYQYARYGSSKIICIEWMALFKGCLKYAFELKKHNMIRVPTPEEIATYSVYWEIANNSNTYFVGYFQPRGMWNEELESCSDTHVKELLNTLGEIKNFVSNRSRPQ